MLLVFFDRFSKWTELIPLRKATAEHVIKGFRERILSRYGVPKILITDNGSQYTSRVFRTYLEQIGVHHQMTAPYTPQENPTERINRTLKTMIAQVIENRHNQWDDKLPEISLAINTSISDTTKYTPAHLTQGREPRLPKALYDEGIIGTGASQKLADDRAAELREIFAIVRRNIAKASQDQCAHYNLRRRPWRSKIGDLVLHRQHHLSKAGEQFTAKLSPKFEGPYQIIAFASPVIVKLLGTSKNDIRTAHIQDVKPYYT